MRQAQALRVMFEGASVFLTGAPGAGKTYVLNDFIRRAEKRGKRLAVTASTGIAATHIGGTTIHSWSGLGIRDRLTQYDTQWLKSNDRLKKRYNGVDVLIIDEISMLHGSRLDMVNEACKILRESEAPFGGLQVILVGDLFQLPPINRAGELVDFAHTSAAWQELNPKICYITEQHRQSSDALLEMLEAMRAGALEDVHAESLRSRLGAQPEPGLQITKLYTHNIDVDTINTRQLKALNSDERRYTMVTKGAAAKIEQLAKSVLAPETLTLKIGAEVMFVANNFAQGFVNGTRGRVVDFAGNTPLVELASGKTVSVEPHSWSLVEDDRKKAEVVQLPLRLAWAITIHKSQGMSLDHAEIDLSKSFTPGMGYVALSRVRSLDGVYLTGVNQMALQLHPDIFEFDRRLQKLSAELAEVTEDMSEEAVRAAAEAVDVLYDEGLLEALKRWRTNRARQDKVAPFMVAHNTALEALALQRPATMQQLLGVKGFGPAKQTQYGAEILAIINDRDPSAPPQSADDPGADAVTLPNRYNNAIIIHGSPSRKGYYDPETPCESDRNWIPWLKKQLLLHEVQAVAPNMPHAYKPDYEAWKKEVERHEIGPRTLLVGHSAGGGFWVRYLSEHPTLKVGRVVLVAPWLDPNNIRQTTFFGFEIDPDIARRTDGLTIFNSDNDHPGILMSVETLRSTLQGYDYQEFHDYGHFFEEEMGTKAFPELLHALLRQ